MIWIFIFYRVKDAVIWLDHKLNFHCCDVAHFYLIENNIGFTKQNLFIKTTYHSPISVCISRTLCTIDTYYVKVFGWTTDGWTVYCTKPWEMPRDRHPWVSLLGPRPSASVTHRCRHYSSSIDSCKTGISLALGITGDKEGDLWPWGTLDCKHSSQSVASLLCRAWNTSDTPSMCLLVRMMSQLSLSPCCTVECFKFTNMFFVEILCPVWTTA